MKRLKERPVGISRERKKAVVVAPKGGREESGWKARGIDIRLECGVI